MFTKIVNDVELAVANEDGAVNAGLRWVLGPDDNMPNMHLRVVELGKEGKSMHHKHDYEHEVFVLEGSGWLVGENNKLELKPGIAAYVPAKEIHQFQNAGEETFKFICVIPKVD